MPLNLLSRVRKTWKDELTRSHLRSVFGGTHSDLVDEAVQAGVPMDLMVALHNACAYGERCQSYDNRPNRALRLAARYVGNGGDPAHLWELMNGTLDGSISTRDVAYEMQVFSHQVLLAKTDTSAWARQHDWAREYLNGGADVPNLMSRAVQEEYGRYLTQIMWSSLLVQARCYEVPVMDLLSFAPDMNTSSYCDHDRRQWDEEWRRIAHWLKSFGPERSRLLFDAGLTLNEGYDCDADDDTLAMMAALRVPA